MKVKCNASRAGGMSTGISSFNDNLVVLFGIALHFLFVVGDGGWGDKHIPKLQGCVTLMDDDTKMRFRCVLVLPPMPVGKCTNASRNMSSSSSSSSSSSPYSYRIFYILKDVHNRKINTYSFVHFKDLPCIPPALTVTVHSVLY